MKQYRKDRANEPEVDNAESDGSGMSADSQAFIGLKLRELYDDVVAEPVPDRLKQLLEQLGDDDNHAR